MSSKLSHNFVLGISDKSTVKLDFDRVTFKMVKYWAERTCNWFKLGGFLVLHSSKNSYHVVFDSAVSWEKNIHIMCWVAVESHISKLKDYVLMQGIKESSTLRVTPKLEKHFPRIVHRSGSQNGEIRNFLSKRRTIKQIFRRF